MKKFLVLGALCLALFAVFMGQAENKVGAADVVTTASIVNKEDAFIKAISDKGTWIICTLKDLKFDKELVVSGEFKDKNDASKPLFRKLALYTQDQNRAITARYTVTAPKMIIKSPNTRLHGGIFVGDIYVEANGFNLYDATVKGNIYFAKEEYKKSFDMSNKGVVTGKIAVK